MSILATAGGGCLHGSGGAGLRDLPEPGTPEYGAPHGATAGSGRDARIARATEVPRHRLVTAGACRPRPTPAVSRVGLGAAERARDARELGAQLGASAGECIGGVLGRAVAAGLVTSGGAAFGATISSYAAAIARNRGAIARRRRSGRGYIGTLVAVARLDLVGRGDQRQAEQLEQARTGHGRIVARRRVGCAGAGRSKVRRGSTSRQRSHDAARERYRGPWPNSSCRSGWRS